MGPKFAAKSAANISPILLGGPTQAGGRATTGRFYGPVVCWRPARKPHCTRTALALHSHTALTYCRCCTQSALAPHTICTAHTLQWAHANERVIARPLCAPVPVCGGQARSRAPHPQPQPQPHLPLSSGLQLRPPSTHSSTWPPPALKQCPSRRPSAGRRPPARPEWPSNGRSMVAQWSHLPAESWQTGQIGRPSGHIGAGGQFGQPVSGEIHTPIVLRASWRCL